MLANSVTLRRLGAVLAFTALTGGLMAGPLALSAYAEGTASTFVVEGNLSKDGSLAVKQTITFAGSAPATVSQKFETREDLVGDRQYVQELSNIAATAKGAAVNPTTQTSGRFTTVTVPTNGATEVVMTYTVTGALVNIDGGGTALRWALLQGLSAQVGEFDATVQIPTQFSYIKCTAGNPNSTIPCNFAAAGTEGTQIPTFRDGPRGEGQNVSVDIGFPAGALTSNEKIDYRWTVARAFSAKPLPLGIALGLLVLGGIALVLLHRRAGADVASGQLSKAGEFVPVGPGQSEFRVVGDVRPGHVGTVADERVDPIDVTATLVDLAVRGHLLITELPRESEFARTDWELQRTDVAAGGLRPFEQQLLDGLAAPGGSVKVSELASRVHESISGVQSALYDEMVSNGWYERRPDATRNRWTQLALGALIVAVVVTGVLAALTTFGLVGLALVVLALGLIFVAQEMPSRTATGAALLGGLGALRSDLLSHPTDQLPKGDELKEISEVLPYAIVLGGTDRWLDAIVASDTDEDADSDDLSWYHGPENWHLQDFPHSMKNFVTTVSGSLFTR